MKVEGRPSGAMVPAMSRTPGSAASTSSFAFVYSRSRVFSSLQRRFLSVVQRRSHRQPSGGTRHAAPRPNPRERGSRTSQRRPRSGSARYCVPRAAATPWGLWVGGVGPDPDHASHAACEDNGCREMTVARVEESVLAHLLAGQAVNPILWPPLRGYDNLGVHGVSWSSRGAKRLAL